jgi:hypothetical protein
MLPSRGSICRARPPGRCIQEYLCGRRPGSCDIDVCRSRDAGQLHRVSHDDWQIAACPHQGPSLSVSSAGTYHVTWYTSGKVRKGLFYAHSQDGGLTFSNPLPVGRTDHGASRPHVLTGPHGTAMVWKEFDGETTTVNLMTSRDDGMTWSKPTTAAKTTDTSDHPLLVSDGQRIFLSWMTKADGYRFQVIEDAP